MISYEQWKKENPLLAEYEILQEFLSEHEEEATPEDIERFNELEDLIYGKGGLLCPEQEEVDLRNERL